MPDEPINGREPEFSEEDLQREALGPRGVPGKENLRENDAAGGKEYAQRSRHRPHKVTPARSNPDPRILHSCA